MRHFIQIFVMLGDVAIIVASAYMIYSFPTDPFIWLMVAMTFYVWQGQGGFIAWNRRRG